MIKNNIFKGLMKVYLTRINLRNETVRSQLLVVEASFPREWIHPDLSGRE